MCGIAGIIDFNTDEVDAALLTKVRDSLKHRGPDDAGFWTGRHAGLGSRRLAVQDTSSLGHMPMTSRCGRYHLVFNGEIYNFQSLRLELEACGHHFTSRSDTEVLLEAYLRWGSRTPLYLEGMFAFAVWDSRDQSLFLCRDRLGVKPLFYLHTPGCMYFASELHALTPVFTQTPEEIDRKSLDSYLAFGFVPPDRCIYRSVSKLPPAHSLHLDRNGITLSPYWQLPSAKPKYCPLASALSTTEDLLRAAVRKRLVSDVPLGCFLSGGIDSSLVVALAAQETGKGLHTFSVAFEGGRSHDDERPLARMVAERYGTVHTELLVGREGRHILPRLLYHVAEPFVDISLLPVFLISKAAREHITVALTGDGGDESFAGYANIRASHAGELIRTHLPACLRPLLKRLSGHGRANRFYSQYVEKDALAQYDLRNHWHEGLRPRLTAPLPPIIPPLPGGSSPAREMIRKIQAKVSHLTAAEIHLYTDLQLRLPGDYLTKVDIASNLVSLEIRSPFLDHHLVEYAASLPLSVRLRFGRQKYLLRKLAEKFLPPALTAQPKRGFGPRLGEWIRSDWAEPVRDLVSGSLASRPCLFDGTLVRTVVDDHMSGRGDHTTRIWSLLSFEIWYQLFLTKTLRPDDSL